MTNLASNKKAVTTICIAFEMKIFIVGIIEYSDLV